MPARTADGSVLLEGGRWSGSVAASPTASLSAELQLAALAVPGKGVPAAAVAAAASKAALAAALPGVNGAALGGQLEQEPQQQQQEQQRQEEEQEKEQQEKGQQAEPGAPGAALTCRSFWDWLPGHRTDLAALVVLAVLTAGCAVGVALQREHTWLRSVWLSTLLGPPGCAPAWPPLRGVCIGRAGLPLVGWH